MVLHWPWSEQECFVCVHVLAMKCDDLTTKQPSDDLDHLTELSDDQVSEQLTAVKGIGQWSADMFLIFHLGRPDILAVGDLGIRRAAERAYGLKKIPDATTLTRIAEPWRPYRSLACLYLWASLDNAPV